jgi:two-component system response regulator YesN
MRRLLIIDDEYGIRTGIASYFPWASLGIEVGATCQDGFEALEAMASSRFDFVLCDIRMPRMDGLRFAEIARERGYHCDIVFISAYKDFEYAKKAIELGVKDYIVKPAGYEELQASFSKLMAEAGAKAGSGSRSAEEGAAHLGAGTDLGPRLALLLDRDLRSVTLPIAARKLEMSPNYLSSRLHKETGKTFSELLMTARMTRARTLLADRANRVRDISAMVGYASVKSFIRAFKAFHGGSPTEFRGPNDA